MSGELHDRTVLVVGRGSGIARAVALAARDAGARVVVAGRDADALGKAYLDEPGIRAETVDVTDDASIAALGDRLGTLDHIVSTASSRARGTLAVLQRDSVPASLDTKVVGPMMLAKHLGPRTSADGSLVLFSGASASKVTVGTLAVAVTNGAAETLTRALAVELAPIRVNAVSPGTIDTGAWDALGEHRKAALFADTGARNPARRIGTADDVARVVLFLASELSSYVTGQVLGVDGGMRR